FQPGADLELYYEVTQTEPGRSYRHEITVYRLKDPRRPDRRRPEVTLGFAERAASPLSRSHRTLQLGRLRPGTYLVEVRVAAAGGSAPATRQRIIRVGELRSSGQAAAACSVLSRPWCSRCLPASAATPAIGPRLREVP